MPSGRDHAIETLVDMDPQGNFFRAARVLVSSWLIWKEGYRNYLPLRLESVSEKNFASSIFSSPYFILLFSVICDSLGGIGSAGPL